MFTELLSEDIERGIRGENEGIPTGFDTLDQNINGIQKSMYHLIGGNSGTGKTSFVDLAYVLNPYDWWVKNRDKTDIKLHCEYNSMERNTKYKLAKWTCLKIFKDHKIIVDVPTIFGWKGKKFEIDDDFKKIIFETGKYFDEMFSSGFIKIYEGPNNPTGIYKNLCAYALQNGEVKQIDEHNKKYFPKDENLFVIVVNDHIGKLTSEVNGGNRLVGKQLLDKHSEYMGLVRDRFGFIVVDISQFNRAIGNIERMKTKQVSPEPDDFKESGDPYENADLVLALFNPYKFKIKDYLGYEINKFIAKNGENRFRSLSVLKNSYGADDVIIGLNFLGECGNFRELPTADQFESKPEFYKKAIEFN